MENRNNIPSKETCSKLIKEGKGDELILSAKFLLYLYEEIEELQQAKRNQIHLQLMVVYAIIGTSINTQFCTPIEVIFSKDENPNHKMVKIFKAIASAHNSTTSSTSIEYTDVYLINTTKLN